MNGKLSLKWFKLSDIKVEDRIRKDLKDIQALADSILQHGLIHPVVIDDTTMRLIAGGRRWNACNIVMMKVLMDKETYPNGLHQNHPAYRIALGEIPCTCRSELTDRELRMLELEENLRRESLDWTEEVEALAKIDELARQVNEQKQADAGVPFAERKDWTVAQTAEKLGRTKTDVQEKVRFAKQLRERQDLKEKLANLPIGRAMQKLEQIEHGEKIQRLQAQGAITFTTSLSNTDALSFLQSLPNASVDLFLMDPPFGISEIDDQVGKTAGTSTLYTADLKQTDNLTIETATTLMESLSVEMFRVLKPGGLFYTFFGMDLYAPLVASLRAAGFWVDPQPIIWNKMRTTNRFSGYRFCPCYEPILTGGRPSVGKKAGDSGCCRRLNEIAKFSIRKIVECSPVDSRVKMHPFQKPIDLLCNFIKISTNPGEIVCDLFAGSGATLKAAYECGRTGIGCELDKDRFAVAQGNLLGLTTEASLFSETKK